MIAAMMSKMQIVAMPRNAPVAVSARSSFGKRFAISKITSYPSPRLALSCISSDIRMSRSIFSCCSTICRYMPILEDS